MTKMEMNKKIEMNYNEIYNFLNQYYNGGT